MKIFDAWHGESEHHRNYFNRAQENYLKGFDDTDIKKGWNKVSSKIDKRRSRSIYLRYAAVAVVLITVGSFWLSNNENVEVQVSYQDPIVLEKSIEIGKDKATLTLEDGSQITLEKGESYETDKVASNGKELVYKNKSENTKKSFAQNILTIPRGGQFSVVLTDGTRVWINSETQLKYPTTFAENKTREVTLVYGEAYFDVSPSVDHNGTHFIVHTSGQQVEVLGTEFNIKAYNGDDHIYTTLVEGKVVVDNGSTSKNLTPGLQSKLNRNTNELAFLTVEVYDEISWKNGFFSFKEKSLEDIMAVLSRWYDVDVVFQNESIKKLTFNGIFRKTQPIGEIFQILKNINEVNIKINDKIITME